MMKRNNYKASACHPEHRLCHPERSEGSILWREFLNRPFTAFRVTVSAISESPKLFRLSRPFRVAERGTREESVARVLVFVNP